MRCYKKIRFFKKHKNIRFYEFYCYSCKCIWLKDVYSHSETNTLLYEIKEKNKILRKRPEKRKGAEFPKKKPQKNINAITSINQATNVFIKVSCRLNSEMLRYMPDKFCCPYLCVNMSLVTLLL